MANTMRVVHCKDCNQIVVRMIADRILTASCPQCKPIAAFLEWLGLTQGEAFVATLIGAGIVSLTRDE